MEALLLGLLLLLQLLDALAERGLPILEHSLGVCATGESAVGPVPEARRGPAVTSRVQGDEIGMIGEHRVEVRRDLLLDHVLGVQRTEIVLMDRIAQGCAVRVGHGVDRARPQSRARPELPALRRKAVDARVAALNVELLERRLDQRRIVQQGDLGERVLDVSDGEIAGSGVR